jgi:CRISPR system Cascade subunit CasE
VGVIAPEQVNAIIWTAVPAHELQVRNWSDFEQVHRAVMALFRRDLPGDEAGRRAESGILFRVDNTPAGKVVLVQSSEVPARLTPGAVTKDASRVLQLRSGTAVRFRVAINAVTRESVTTDRRRVVERPVPEAGVEEWLAGRLATALEQVSSIDSRRTVSILQAGQHRGRALQVDVVDGVAVIGDPARLAELIKCGVGRGKAYGCALLTVAPIR